MAHILFEIIAFLIFAVIFLTVVVNIFKPSTETLIRRNKEILSTKDNQSTYNDYLITISLLLVILIIALIKG